MPKSKLQGESSVVAYLKELDYVKYDRNFCGWLFFVSSKRARYIVPDHFLVSNRLFFPKVRSLSLWSSDSFGSSLARYNNQLSFARLSCHGCSLESVQQLNDKKIFLEKDLYLVDWYPRNTFILATDSSYLCRLSYLYRAQESRGKTIWFSNLISSCRSI